MKLIFCMQINIRVSYKLISILWACQISCKVILSLLMGMTKLSQSTQSNKLEPFNVFLRELTWRRLIKRLLGFFILSKARLEM